MKQDKTAKLISNVIKYGTAGVFVTLIGGILFTYVLAEKRGRESALAYEKSQKAKRENK